MARVLIVEDDAATREGLSRLLARNGYEVLTAMDGTRALAAAREGVFDVVLLDLNLPGVPGLELIRLLRQRDATLPIVVLTGEGSLANAVAAMRHGGAFDFLQKPVTDLGALQAAVARAYTHGVLAREAAGNRAVSAAPPAQPRLDLSPRDWALLRMVAQGYSNERIGVEICLSPKTVRNYLSALYGRIGARNRTEAALLLRRWEPD